MDGWNTTFLLGPGLFSGALAVSFRESILPESWACWKVVSFWWFLIQSNKKCTFLCFPGMFLFFAFKFWHRVCVDVHPMTDPYWSIVSNKLPDGSRGIHVGDTPGCLLVNISPEFGWFWWLTICLVVYIYIYTYITHIIHVWYIFTYI